MEIVANNSVRRSVVTVNRVQLNVLSIITTGRCSSGRIPSCQGDMVSVHLSSLIKSLPAFLMVIQLCK